MSGRSLYRWAVLSVLALWVAGSHASETAHPPLTPTPRTAAQIDLTGFWVSSISEDWLFRMITPGKGNGGSIPLNKEGARVMREWNPPNDNAHQEPCKAYGAAGIMRRPGSLHIVWENDTTLRIDLDAGTQTRLLHFAPFLPAVGFATSQAPLAMLRFQAPGPPSLQGYSIASWTKVAAIRGLQRVPAKSTPPPEPHSSGALMVVTTQLTPAYLQKNGVPYSEDAVLTEYFDRIRLPDGHDYLVVKSIVEDPLYLGEPFVTTALFRREEDGSRWNPYTCDPD